MSLATWLAEFYPVPAGRTQRTDLERIEHAIKRCRGLTEKRRKRHGIRFDQVRGAFSDDSGNTIDTSQVHMSLCHAYFFNCPDPCSMCPLVLSGSPACTPSTWEPSRNPTRLMLALQAARRYVKERNRK